MLAEERNNMKIYLITLCCSVLSVCHSEPVFKSIIDDHEYAQFYQHYQSFQDTNFVGAPVEFELKQHFGKAEGSKRGVASNVLLSVKKKEKQQEFRTDIKKKLDDAVALAWRDVCHEQFWARCGIQTILMDGMGLGICLEQLEIEFNDPGYLFSFEPYTQLSDEELVENLNKANETIFKLTEDVITELIQSDKSGELKRLKEKKELAWKLLISSSSSDVKGLDSLLEEYSSMSDFQVRSELMGSEDVSRIIRYFESEIGLEKYMTARNSVDEFRSMCSAMILSNSTIFQEKLESLQSAYEENTKIRGLRAYRTVKKECLKRSLATNVK
jgi:hypothetical protein